MSALWLAAIPSGVWATRALGNTINESLFRQNRPEPPNPHLDYQGALASADAALAACHPVSPTATHLRLLVYESAERLRKLIAETEERIHKHSWSRYFRDPDFSQENRATELEIETLKSRVTLFLSVMLLFPQKDVEPFTKTLTKDNFRTSSDEECSDAETEESEEPEENLGHDVPLEPSFWQQLMDNAKL